MTSFKNYVQLVCNFEDVDRRPLDVGVVTYHVPQRPSLKVSQLFATKGTCLIAMSKEKSISKF